MKITTTKPCRITIPAGVTIECSETEAACHIRDGRAVEVKEQPKAKGKK